MTVRSRRTIELGLLVAGALLLFIFVAALLHREILSRTALETFKAANPNQTTERSIPLSWTKEFRHDFSLWSGERVAAYKTSLSLHFDPPLAVLRISKINLEVPVLSGTDDLTLNRGVGLIRSTARPGDNGNIGIAGHRDGFFRGLKDIGPGDTIELESPGRIDVYRVAQIVIVRPDDVSVLQPTSFPQLTLVTCYPFYFIGSAPKRYIVLASLVAHDRSPSEKRRAPTDSAFLKPAVHDSNPQPQNSIKEITQ